MCRHSYNFFGGDAAARFIDLEINIHATNQDLVFEEFKDGFVGIEHTLTYALIQAQARCKGSICKARNSEGIEGKSIWGNGRLGSLSWKN